MRNLEESIKGLNEHYLELLKNLNRVLDINLEMLERSNFDKTLYGECLVTENTINNFEVKIKEDSIFTIARFQPAASNLRLLIMLINSARVIERMGDILKSNLKIIKNIETISPEMNPYLKDIILPIAKKTKNIYEGYINAFIKSDEKTLFTLLTMDEEIDELTRADICDIVEIMKKNSKNIEGGTDLIVLCKKFERFADHILHLVFDLIYILKGKDMRKVELLEDKKI
ncbi:PhoU domain-containing protein [Fusobacterium sp.]|uniref:phosphate signaling complex PhoU family protein n=1 Tax=Fusobacterium sp. TaxID=68766 RepID=UPI002603A517|nr:PhoU domain-containing protein [Fusobacterium sp.]